MISIKVNETFLHLDAKTRLSIEFYNTVFSDEVMQGDFVMPVNIPYKGNAVIFGWLYELNGIDRTTTYDKVTIYYNKTALARGALDILSVDANYISASIRINMAALPCMSKKLSEFNLGGQRILGATMPDIIASANYIAALDFNDTDYNFPMVYNPDFYGDKNPDYAGFMNNYEPGIGFYDNTPGNRNCLVPMIYLLYLLRQGFASDDYAINGWQCLTGIDDRPLTIYNNRALDSRSSADALKGFCVGLTVALIYSSSIGENGIIFDDALSGSLFNHDTCYSTSSGAFTVTYAGLHSLELNLNIVKVNYQNTPSGFFTVKIYHNAVVIYVTTQYLNTQYKHVNIKFNLYFNTANIGEAISATIDAHVLMQVAPTSTFSITNYVTVYGPNHFQGSFYLNDHVPDITFGTLLNALRQTFNVGFIWDHISRTVDMVGLDMLAPYHYTSDITSKKTIGHKIIFNKDKIIKSFNFTFPGDDGLVNENFKAYDPLFYLGAVTTLNHAESDYTAEAAKENRLLLIRNLNQLWRCELQLDTTWQWVFFTDNYFDVTVDVNGSKDIRPMLAPLFMKDHVTNYSTMQHFLTVAIKQQGTSTEFDIGETPYSLRIFHHLGRRSESLANAAIPFSTTTNIDGLGATTYQVNLAWLGENTVSLSDCYNTLVAALSIGEWYEVKLHLQHIALTNFIIGGRWFMNYQHWLMESVKVEVGDTIGEATVNMLKI